MLQKIFMGKLHLGKHGEGEGVSWCSEVQYYKTTLKCSKATEL